MAVPSRSYISGETIPLVINRLRSRSGSPLAPLEPYIALAGGDEVYFRLVPEDDLEEIDGYTQHAASNDGETWYAYVTAPDVERPTVYVAESTAVIGGIVKKSQTKLEITPQV